MSGEFCARSSRLVSLVLLVACLTVSAEGAGRRRLTTSPSPAVNPGGGGCVTFGLVRAGLKATYLSTSASGNVTSVITYVSDTPTVVNTTQKVTTPQATADAETRIDMEAAGQTRATRHVYVKTTTAVPVIGSLVTETDIDLVPSLVYGPVSGWCAGAKWTVPATTITTVNRSIAGTQTLVQTSTASESEVLSVNESLVTPGGTFTCVKYRGKVVSGTNVGTAITWISREHNIMVREDDLDANGNVTTSMVLTALQ